MNFLILIPYILLGTLMAGLVSLIPALHIFNLAGFILLYFKFPQLLPGNALPAFMMSLVVSWSIINTIPALFLGAPDESAMFIVLPGQKYMMLGKGYEAAVLSGVGAMGAIIALGIGSPVILRLFPRIRWLLIPHMGWILLLICAYIIMGEWPKATLRSKTKWGRFIDGWKSSAAGILTFILAGLLGIFILNKPFIPIERAFQNIMPAFVGLYAVPWVITNIISKTEIPKQNICTSIDLDYKLAIRGTFAGVLGGSFAALLPIITGGIGGLIAGHATAQRDDRLFIISQGASKTTYYVGGFLLFFVPYFGLYHLRRGGMAWMLSPFYVPRTIGDYFIILATITLSAGFAFFLLLRFSRFVINIITKFDYRLISLFTVVILFAIVLTITGLRGIFITIVATGIGLIPVLFHSRRMNCMAILLVHMTLSMFGVESAVLKFFHLI